ncbi:helix-turn-helix domain-containing protein, partial [Streptococcus agalactiae]|uniref:helix-turn-helix domain-containing protein n=1 Tax=Streptococcus agalactiae TaxID=1311 RepID=UPI000AE19798
MIENFLEKNILNKVKLLTLCYDTPSLSLDTACNRLHLSPVELKNYCHKLDFLRNKIWYNSSMNYEASKQLTD